MARGLSVFVNIGAKVSSSVGASASALERRFSAMGRTLRLASASARADLIATERSFGRIGRNFQKFSYQAGLPMAGVAAYGAKAAYNWAKVGNELQAVTQMTDQQRKSIEGVARAQIGSPTENLKGALDLARSGFDTKQIGLALPTVLKLSRSDPSVDSAAAADIATNVIQGMRLPAEKFASAADQLAFAASKSSTDVRLLGESFKYAGPIAARMGSTMAEMNAGFMTMANAGIKGSESGVAFRAMLVRMVKPTKGGLATLDQLGMNMGDYVSGKRAGNSEDVIAFMRAQGIDASRSKGQIDKAIGSGATGTRLYQQITDIISSTLADGGDAVDRNVISEGVISALTSGAEKVDWVKFVTDLRDKGATAAQINTIFDARQGTRIMTLMSGDDLHRNLLLMQQGAPGWLQKMFSVNNKGIVGSVGRLSQSLGNLVITLSETGVIDTAAKGIDWMARSITGLSKTNPGLLKFMTYAALGLAVLGPARLVFSGVAAAIRAVGAAVVFAFKALGGRSLLGFLFSGVGKAGPRIPGIMRIFNALKILFGGLARWAGPLILRGMAALAPMVMEGLVAAFALLSNPIGWVVLAVGVAGALIFAFRKQIAAAWPGVAAFFRTKAADLKNAFLSINWGAVGMAIANGLTFGLAGVVANVVAKVKAAGTVAGGPGVNRASLPRAPGRAMGGHVGAGGLYTVGERGRELFAPGQSGTVIPARTTAALMAAANGNSHAGGGVTIGDIHIHGANDPQTTRRVIREEFRRIAVGQRGGLHD